MKLYIMLIKPHSNSSRNICWSKTKEYIHNINDTEVFDEQYIEWFKNSTYYDEKNTTIIPVKFIKQSGRKCDG